ncbi:NACHT domain-containing protein [Nocardiopsis lambiniae]|uniref:NACHT domain-containing protein n=1 Tax=Nocardiopsis lambiniae TaxID=3075539 RepID=A0ABU2M9V5_9ACTN|nr:NACHT domain-containing protein [Nocardiopsis sp. DSM 44743]MDT0329365.1 NACHT domain-containing protein [Nocardiopsis sp. DSM 44743]
MVSFPRLARTTGLAVINVIISATVNLITNNMTWTLFTLLVGAVIIAIMMEAPNWFQRTSPSTEEQIERVRTYLARSAQSEWRAQLSLRGVDARGVIHSRWIFRSPPTAPIDITLDEEGIRRLGELVTEGQTRTVIVNGGPGMGKTTLAGLLVHQVASKAQEHTQVPVPVFLPLSSWDMSRHPGVEAWIRHYLERLYPVLTSGEYGTDPIAPLIERGGILPVFDGLDEVFEQKQKDIVEMFEVYLSYAPDRRLIVTGRTQQVRAAMRTARHSSELRAAAVLAPRELRPTDIRDYITGLLNPPGTAPLSRAVPPAWQEVLGRFDDRNDGLTMALATPVDLWILRATYLETERDPGDLISLAIEHEGEGPVSAREAVTHHLLDQLVPMLSGTARRQAQRGDPGGSASSSFGNWPVEKAETWLGYLADYLRQKDLTDYEWRRLRDAPPAWAVSVVLAIAFSIGLGGVAWVGAVLALGSDRPWLWGTALGFLGGVCALLSSGFRKGPEPAYSERGGGLPRALRSSARFIGRVGLVVLVLVMTGAYVQGMLGSGDPLLGGIGFGLLGGIASGTTVFILQWTKPHFALDRAPSPQVDLRVYRQKFLRNLGLGMLFGALGGSGVDVLFSFFPGLESSTWLSVVSGALGGAMIGLVAPNPWLGYCIGLTALVVSRRMPLRLSRFLEDAHRAGLLRQVGVVYQFRHERLRDHLASQGHYPGTRHDRTDLTPSFGGRAAP